MDYAKTIKQGLRKILPDRARLLSQDILSYLDLELKSYKPLQYENKRAASDAHTPRVLILGLRTYRYYDLAVFEKVLTDVLVHNGAKVTNLLCGNALDSCDADSGEEKNQGLACKKCAHERKHFMKLYHNDFIFFKEFLPAGSKNRIRSLVMALDDKELLSFTYLDINIAAHAVDSVRRYYRKNTLNFEDAHTREVLRHKLIQGALCVEAAKNILRTVKPTHFITIHGVYVSWGPMAEYFRNNGVKVCIHAKTSEIVGKVLFFKDGVDNDIFAKDAWFSFKQMNLTDNQKKRFNEFMQNKKNANTFIYKLYGKAFKNSASQSIISEKLNDTTKTKFVLYPNLLWDAGLEAAGSRIFKDVNDWLVETISYFKTKKDCYLFIKPHPGERMDADFTKQGVEYTVRLLLDNHIPNNVFFVPNDYRVTAFDLMEKNVVGITYNGTVGIEHAYFKKPIIVAGTIHYAEAGIVPKVLSRDEYFGLIDAPGRLTDYADSHGDIIEKFCYYHYFMAMIDIPFYRKDRWLGHCINWEALDDYQAFIEHDPTMNKLASDILQWRPILNNDTAISGAMASTTKHTKEPFLKESTTKS